jgi:hypothetical protein
VAFFILGILSMSAAMAIALSELKASLDEVIYEHKRIKHLRQPA